jgi:hypothetical protein
MAQLGAKNNQQAHGSVVFSVLAPSAILTPQRLRDRELARAAEAPSGNDAPALQELRMFLQMQSLS